MYWTTLPHIDHDIDNTWTRPKVKKFVRFTACLVWFLISRDGGRLNTTVHKINPPNTNFSLDTQAASPGLFYMELKRLLVECIFCLPHAGLEGMSNNARLSSLSDLGVALPVGHFSKKPRARSLDEDAFSAFFGSLIAPVPGFLVSTVFGLEQLLFL